MKSKSKQKILKLKCSTVVQAYVRPAIGMGPVYFLSKASFAKPVLPGPIPGELQQY